MNTPRRCPFCGGEAKITKQWVKESGKTLSLVLCPNCGSRTAALRTEEDAIKIWNSGHEEIVAELTKRLARYSRECLENRLEIDFALAVEEAIDMLCRLATFNYLHKEGSAMLAEELKECKNELCEKCGLYRQSHLGACDNCKWYGEKA